MDLTIRQKILVMFLLLTLLIIIATSGVYYYLFIKDIRELSHKQITIAFDLMFDEFVSRTKRVLPMIDRFVQDSLTGDLYVLYSVQEQFSATQEVQDWKQIQGLWLSLSRIATKIGNFAPLIESSEYTLYDRDGRVIAAYLHSVDREIWGMYLHQVHEGTFIPLHTLGQLSATLKWQNIQDIPKTPLPDGVSAMYKGNIPDTSNAMISKMGETTAIKFIVPIFRNENLQGACVINTVIRQHDVERYSRFSQTEVNIFVDTSLSVGTLPDYSTVSFGESETFHNMNLLDLQDIPPIDYSEISIHDQPYYQGKIVFGDTNRVLGAITANFPRQIEKEKGQELFTLIALVTVGVGVFTAIVAFILSSRLARPITNITKLVSQIAEGDLTGAIGTRRHDEIGASAVKGNRFKKDEIVLLSHSFHQMVTYLRSMATIAENISRGDISQTIAPRSERDTLGNAFCHMTEYLHDSATVTAAIAEGDLAVEISLRSGTDTFGQTMRTMTTGLQSLIRQIRTSAEQIASTGTTIVSLTDQDRRIVEDEQASVAAMVSTMTEMGESVKDVAQNMEMLSSSVEQTLPSVAEVTSSITNIASGTTDLARQTQRMISVLDEAVRMLEGVTEQTEVSRQLSEETSQDALEGQQAVEQVRESMNTIQQTNLNAKEAITRLAQQSRDIGTILDVIRSITEQSSLLALNASIIAAQAGSQGKGFSVIADEMKNLANEVEASTKNIAAIVRSVQQETNTVVQMIQDGAAKIEQGVTRTQQAQQRLQKILNSAQRSSSVVSEIADALHKQMTTGHEVSNAMEQVHTMTAEITRATSEQKASMIQIHNAIEHIADIASRTKEATAQQLEGVNRVLNTSHRVSTLTDQNLESSQHLNRAITADLAVQAEILLDSVDRFRLETKKTPL